MSYGKIFPLGGSGGSTPSGIAGAIQFSDGSAFASDAANLFWDDTNNRLGIGTNAPTQVLDIVTTTQIPLKLSNNQTFVRTLYSNNSASGTFDFINNYFSFGGNNLVVGSSSNLNARLGVVGSGSTSATTSLLVQNSAGTELMRVRDNGLSTFTSATAYGRAIETANNGIIRSAGGYENADGVYGADSGLFLRAAGNMYITANNGNTASFGLFGTGSGFNIGTGLSVDASAVLNLNSTNRGFLPPRMTTTQKNAIATPASGLVVYDTTTNKLCCYNGSTWNDLF